MNTPNSTSSTAVASTRAVSNKALLIALGLVVLIGAGLYVGGLMQGRSEIDTQKTGYERQLTAGRGALEQSKAQLIASQNRLHLMQGVVAVYRTATDLDQRNFGIANTRLQEAAASLGEIKSGSAGIDTARIAALRTAIAATDVSVATDLQAQRDAILAFATELDAIAAKAQ